jgi:hypothetical protein
MITRSPPRSAGLQSAGRLPVVRFDTLIEIKHLAGLHNSDGLHLRRRGLDEAPMRFLSEGCAAAAALFAIADGLLPGT